MLVIGIGNEFRGDDAAGLLVVRALNALGVSAVEFNGDGVSLTQLWEHHAEVIVIDAAKSGSPPGTIHRYEAHRGSLPADIFAFSTHMLGLAEAIELSRVLDNLPKSLIVYGIEGKDFEINHTISKEVKYAIDAVTAETLSLCD